MRAAPPEPFPFDAVRDLLGVVRALYLAARARGATLPELNRIHRVGRELREALDLAKRSGGSDSGLAEAWQRAEAASRSVSALVGPLDAAEPMVSAARKRVKSRG